MPKIAVTDRSGARCSIDAAPGRTLKQAIFDGGVSEIEALTSCGGNCSCGTCHVFVDPDDAGRLPPLKPEEDMLLDIHDTRTAFSRLSCQVVVTDALDGLHVTVAPPL